MPATGVHHHVIKGNEEGRSVPTQACSLMQRDQCGASSLKSLMQPDLTAHSMKLRTQVGFAPVAALLELLMLTCQRTAAALIFGRCVLVHLAGVPMGVWF